MSFNKVDYEATKNIPIALTKEFVSGQLATTVGSQLIVTHGLGVIPKHVVCELVCVAAEAGYSIGMVIGTYNTADNGSANDGLSIVRDATNITVRFGASGGLPILDYTTGATTRITPSRWRLIVRAWA